MNKAEYARRVRTQKDWAPGWDAIAEEMRAAEGSAALYLPQKRRRKTLEGFGVCPAPGGFSHIVSRGLSQIWPNENAFISSRSGWGIELTVQWPGAAPADCAGAFELLERLAQYIDVRKVPVQAGGHMPLSRLYADAAFPPESCAGLLFVPDTRLRTIQTIHGEVAFLQLVNVTRYELQQLDRHPRLAAQLEYGLRQAQPLLPMDLRREKSYLL